jgi:hypothetical protein
MPRKENKNKNVSDQRGQRQMRRKSRIVDMEINADLLADLIAPMYYTLGRAKRSEEITHVEFQVLDNNMVIIHAVLVEEVEVKTIVKDVT